MHPFRCSTVWTHELDFTGEPPNRHGRDSGARCLSCETPWAISSTVLAGFYRDEGWTLAGLRI